MIRLALLLCLLATPALGHKIIASVFPSGDVIEGEIGFSNGEMAADTLVEVFDAAGAKLGETRTDSDGFFTWRPADRKTHVFRADLGAGHIAEARMAAADVPVDGPVIESGAPPPPDDTDPHLRAMIAEAVRAEVRPLRHEIAAYKEKNDLQTVLGGLGYILGLFGLGFYLAARRKLSERE